jgi:DNA-binding NarL/FixJ family response regulator
LLKNVPPADLFSGIRAVADGDGVISPAVTRRLLEVCAAHLPDPATGRSAAGDRLARLTDRERDVLGEVARGHSNAEIAAVLGVTQGTVKIHVGRILNKLGLRDRVQIAIFAYESGIVRPGTNPPL